MAHFNLEEWDKAISAWEDGFRIKPVPEFLYNIGQAYRLSKRPERAIAFYQKYLRMSPKAANRGEVERQIASLEKAVSEQQRAARQPPLSPLQPGRRSGEPAVATTTPTTTTPRVAATTTTRVEPPKPAPTTPPPTEETPKPTLAPVPAIMTESPPASADASVTAAPPPAKKPIYKKGWFWGVIAGGVVVIAVGVGLGVGLSSGDSDPTATFGTFVLR